MAKRSRKPDPNRDLEIKVKVTPALKERIRAAAAADNRTMSTWLLNLAEQALARGPS